MEPIERWALCVFVPQEIPAMMYVYLALAILAEAGWAIAMKVSDGLRKPMPTAVMAALYLASVVLLSLAVRRLEVGVAYAIWAGAGAAIIAGAGVAYFGEPATLGKLVSVGLIIAGIAGLGAFSRAG
jgi:multidrug transporter EmrE-like cation transporter